jgi:hypothetical protein
MPRYHDSKISNSPSPNSGRFYQELPLDHSSSRYYQIIALINTKKVYKIDDEEGFASIIQDVDIPPPTAKPDISVRSCVWHLARTGKITQVEDEDWGDDIWVEMMEGTGRKCLSFVDIVARDNRPEFGSSERSRRGRLVAPRIIPAIVFRGERMPPVLGFVLPTLDYCTLHDIQPVYIDQSPSISHAKAPLRAEPAALPS